MHIREIIGPTERKNCLSQKCTWENTDHMADDDIISHIQIDLLVWAATEAARETPENFSQVLRGSPEDTFFFSRLSGNIDPSPNKYGTPMKEMRDFDPLFHL